VKNFHFNISISSAARQLVSIESLTIKPGHIHFLFGESGIGKTLLCQALYGLLDPNELQASVNGLSYERYLQSNFVKEIQQNSFFVFQEPSSHLNPLLTIKEQIREGSLASAGNEQDILRNLWQNVNTERVQSLLDLYPKPFRPSGGEKQRLLLTMAFKKIALLKNRDHSLFVFDEPTGNLDDRYRNQVLKLLLQAYRENSFTVLFITHDYSIISEIFKSHADLKKKIRFQEIRKCGQAQVQQKNFSAHLYLQWLKRLSPSSESAKQGKEVLRLDSGFFALGRKFRFFKDADSKQETSLSIRAGQLIYLKAPSGGGKTSTAKIILGMIPSRGLRLMCCDYKMDSSTPAGFWRKNIWGKHASMVFQHADEALDRQTTVYQTFKGLPLKTPEKRQKILAALQTLFQEKTDEAFLNTKVAFLSGGQKQRLNILRSLILDVDFLILDEPLNGLDFASIDKVLNILQEKRRQGTAVLLISHNEEIFSRFISPDETFHLSMA